MALVSIIVPVYKVEKYLEKCVESLINQTMSDIEIILVDDGSPDNCGNICNYYSSIDPRIKVIHQKNEGLSSARNRGIDTSSGKYICFVDSDDCVSTDYCEVLYNILKNTKCDYSVCGTHRFNDGELISKNINKENNMAINIKSNFQYLDDQIHKKSEFGVWNKMYRRYVFDKIRFADGKLHEDIFFSVDLARNFVNGVSICDKNCYYYRQRQGGIVSQSQKKCSPDLVVAGEYLVDMVKNNYPIILNDSIYYSLNYTWSFVDKIYVNRDFKNNRKFLIEIKRLISDNIVKIKNENIFDKSRTHRMILFSKSKFFYGFNAYTRLFRVYLFRLFNKDAYSNGHGI